MSREALDALEAWHTTTLALRDATPWTAEWVRLRMVAQEQRAAYEALVGATAGSSTGPDPFDDRDPAASPPRRSSEAASK
jgi:hypothetical protein